MSPEQLNILSENVRYIRDKVDETQKAVSDLRVSVEHRLTAVEIRSGFWGVLAGSLSALGLTWFRGR